MLLGIDLGTSSMKAMLFDPRDGTFVLEKEPLEIMQPAPELAEADPELWWDVLVQVLARLRRAEPERFAAVEAVGFSTIYPALIPMARDGAALRNALLYCDRRSLPQVEKLKTDPGEERFAAITGNQLTPGTCVLPGILWLREQEPEVFADTAMFGQATTFMVHRLTGEFVLDKTHALLTGMVRAGAEDRWEPELLACAGISEERLPGLLPSTAVAGHITAAAAEKCGLRKGTPVVAGSGDAPLAALGGGVVGPHQLFCSAGTTDCLMFTGDRPPRNPVFANCHYCLPKLWVSIGTMSTAGASVKWCCEKLLDCSPKQMTAWAASATPGAGGTTFLPYLQGERTPWWDPRAKGIFFGLTLATDRSAMCRAVFEGVAYGWRQIISLIEEEYGFQAPEVIAVGGGSSNRFWNQVKASVLQRPVTVLHFAETTSLGAALIAGLGAGILPDADCAKTATERLRQTETVEPVEEWCDAYEEGFALYHRLYPAVRGLDNPAAP